jgi:hypothetical protein
VGEERQLAQKPTANRLRSSHKLEEQQTRSRSLVLHALL